MLRDPSQGRPGPGLQGSNLGSSAFWASSAPGCSGRWSSCRGWFCPLQEMTGAELGRGSPNSLWGLPGSPGVPPVPPASPPHPFLLTAGRRAESCNQRQGGVRGQETLSHHHPPPAPEPQHPIPATAVPSRVYWGSLIFCSQSWYKGREEKDPLISGETREQYWGCLPCGGVHLYPSPRASRVLPSCIRPLIPSPLLLPLRAPQGLPCPLTSPITLRTR